jgi:HD-like signal output (HDOD) protein
MGMPRGQEIIELLSSVRDLPTLPDIIMRLHDELASPTASTGSVAAIIREDPAWR